MKEINRWDSVEESRMLLTEEQSTLVYCRDELHRVMDLEEISWRQNLEFCGLGKGIGILSSSIAWPILTGGITYCCFNG